MERGRVTRPKVYRDVLDVAMEQDDFKNGRSALKLQTHSMSSAPQLETLSRVHHRKISPFAEKNPYEPLDNSIYRKFMQINQQDVDLSNPSNQFGRP